MAYDDVSRETRRVAEALLQRLAVNDHAGVAELFTDDFDWRLSWPDEELGGAVPWIRERRTREDVAEHFRQLAAHNAPHDGGARIERIVVDGRDAVILGEVRNLMVRSGEPYRAAIALHLTVEGGRIRRYHVFEDSLAVARAWHGRREAMNEPVRV